MDVGEVCTSIVRVTEEKPALLFPHTVKVVEGVARSGVPHIVPFDVPKNRPETIGLLIAHVETSPPEFTGSIGVMVVPFTRTALEGLKDTTGAFSPTSSQI